MKPTQQLHDLGQSIWLDNITRALLTDGTLKRYIDELSVTGLTSNPTIFDNAIRKSNNYDTAIRQKLAAGRAGEALFFDLALEDITAAADLFRPINVASTGTKDPDASDVLYVKSLQAPFTINTMPEETLLDFADHGEIGELLPADGGDAEAMLARFAKAGVDVGALATQLQREGAGAFVQSWNELLTCITAKSDLLAA